MKKRAAWQLPEGVSSGTWDYARSDSVATDYDRYFARHAMFGLDQQVVDRHLEPGGWVIDLGCGTGRALLPMVERGLRGVAFDLSQNMLDEVNRKASPGSVDCVRGNLVDLNCFADQSFDYAVCLFSTLGMVRGSHARAMVVQNVSRLLKPGGLFVLQVHNYWAHLFDPEGPWWMLRNAVRAGAKRDVELGDKFFLYRGIPNMYLHSFTAPELKRLLADSAFEIVEWMPLNSTQSSTLRFPKVVESIRASGWIVVARRTQS